MIEIILTLSVLLFLSALFSGAETAFTALSQPKVEVIKKDGKISSPAVVFLYEKLDIVIMINLIVSNLVNIIISAYVTVLTTSFFGVGIGLTYAVTFTTIAILVFGEILPKKLAILSPLNFSRFSSFILIFLYYLLYIIVIPLSKGMKFFDKFANKDGKNPNDLSEAEIAAVLQIGHKDGALESKEYQMINRLLDFNDKQVKEIMTRRGDIVAVHKDTTLKEIIELAGKENHSRFPVFAEDVGECDWVISIPKLIPFLTNPKNLNKKISEFKPDKALKVPKSKIIDDLFFEFQRKRTHIAIVLDEYGETSGLVTLEDIVEAVFGDIEDETDIQEEKIIKRSDTVFMIDGDTQIQEIEEKLNIKISDDEILPEKTLSWLILEILHGFPKTGQEILLEEKKLSFKILDMDGEYIDKVELAIREV